jgi:hypothetical protein
MLIGVTRSRRSKGIQYNGQNEKGQKDKQRSTNNYTENEISIYTNSRWTQVHISQGRAYKLNIRLLYDGKCIIHSRDLELLWWPSALYFVHILHICRHRGCVSSQTLYESSSIVLLNICSFTCHKGYTDVPGIRLKEELPPP